MSFDLRITFTGMCVFAVDHQADSAGVHVLLPAFGSGDGNPHRHYPRLVYDTAYESGGSRLSRRLVCEKLDRRYMEFPRFQGAGFNPVLPEEIVSLDSVLGGQKLSRALLDKVNPRPELASRLTLPAGAVTDYERGMHFFFEGATPQRMTWRVEWTVRGIPGNSLPLALQPYADSSEAHRLLVLYPVGEVIQLHVFNVLCEDLPKHESEDLPGSVQAEHFDGYEGLFNGVDLLAPRLHRIQETDLGGCEHCPEPTGDETEVHHPEGCGEARTDRAAHTPRDSGSHVRRVGVTARTSLTLSGLGGRPVTCVVTQATLSPS